MEYLLLKEVMTLIKVRIFKIQRQKKKVKIKLFENIYALGGSGYGNLGTVHSLSAFLQHQLD